MNVLSVRYTEPANPENPDAQRSGVMTVDYGDKVMEWAGPMNPPTAGDLAALLQAWKDEGNTPAEPEPELPPAPQARTASVTALADLLVEADEVTAVGIVANFGGAFQLMPGVFWVYFSTPQPDENYTVSAQAPGYNADVTYPLNTDYIEITVSDRVTGEAATPSRLVLDVKRVQ